MCSSFSVCIWGNEEGIEAHLSTCIMNAKDIMEGAETQKSLGIATQTFLSRSIRVRPFWYFFRSELCQGSSRIHELCGKGDQKEIGVSLARTRAGWVTRLVLTFFLPTFWTSYVPLAISQHQFGEDFGPLYQEAKEMALENIQQLA